MATNIKKDFGNKKPELSTLVYGKVPPQATDLERAVIGACLLEKDAFQSVMEVISNGEIFYEDANQKIYQAMFDLITEGNTVDLLTVTEKLRKNGNLEIVGGAYYLATLTMSVVSSAHVLAHARIVFEKFMQREVIRICGSAINDAYDDFSDAFELIDALEADIKDITSGIVSADDITVADSYQNVIAEYDKQKKSPEGLIGVPSGFDDLDAVTSGFCRPSLTLIGALPSQGKTALMLCIGRNAAERNYPGKIYSLETGATNLVRRMAASKNSIPLEQLKNGTLNAFQEEMLRNGILEFLKLKISISYKLFYLEDIIRSIRKEKKKNPALAWIALDFIQLVRLRNNPNRLDKFAIVGEVSRQLKQLSAELDLPIIALSQLTRSVTNKVDRRPEPQNLANSSELEQNADNIIFIYYQDSGEKDEYGKPKVEPILIIAKNKDGKCGDVKIRFNGDTQEWKNYTDFNQNVLPSSVSAGIKNVYPDTTKPASSWDDEFGSSKLFAPSGFQPPATPGQTDHRIWNND